MKIGELDWHNQQERSDEYYTLIARVHALRIDHALRLMGDYRR